MQLSITQLYWIVYADIHRVEISMHILFTVVRDHGFIDLSEDSSSHLLCKFYVFILSQRKEVISKYEIGHQDLTRVQY